MKFLFLLVGGATWILNVNGVRIACDPVLCPAGTVQDYTWFKATRLIEPVIPEDELAAVDLWLITHAHADHLDGPGLARIRPTSAIVTHVNAADTLRRAGAANLRVLHWGEKTELTIRGLRITIEAIPAVHGVNPLTALLAGGVNGYWLTIDDGAEQATVYVTGDTVLARPVRRALAGRAADVLIPNMGAAKQRTFIGTLTLSARMLAELARLLRPQATLPVHFGTFSHYLEPIDAVRALPDKSIRIPTPGEALSFEISRRSAP